MPFDESPVDGVGQGKLLQIGQDIILNLISRKLGTLLKNVLGIHRHRRRLIRNHRHKLVVNNLDPIKLKPCRENLVRDSLRLGKRRDILANLIEGEDKLVGHEAGELGFGFVADDDETKGRVLFFFLAGDAAGGFCEGRVDAAAETLVGGDCEVEGFDGGGGGLGFGLSEDFRVCHAVLAGLLHGSLGDCQAGAGGQALDWMDKKMKAVMQTMDEYLATIFIVFVIFSMLRMDCDHQHQSSTTC